MMTRQQARRVAFKAKKRRAAVDARKAVETALADLRAKRRHPIAQGPGMMTMIGRPFKKPHGRPNWRVRTIVISGFVSAEYHATKGFRRYEIAA